MLVKKMSLNLRHFWCSYDMFTFCFIVSQQCDPNLALLLPLSCLHLQDGTDILSAQVQGLPRAGTWHLLSLVPPWALSQILCPGPAELLTGSSWANCLVTDPYGCICKGSISARHWKLNSESSLRVLLPWLTHIEPTPPSYVLQWYQAHTL